MSTHALHPSACCFLTVYSVPPQALRELDHETEQRLARELVCIKHPAAPAGQIPAGAKQQQPSSPAGSKSDLARPSTPLPSSALQTARDRSASPEPSGIPSLLGLTSKLESKLSQIVASSPAGPQAALPTASPGPMQQPGLTAQAQQSMPGLSLSQALVSTKASAGTVPITASPASAKQQKGHAKIVWSESAASSWRRQQALHRALQEAPAALQL